MLSIGVLSSGNATDLEPILQAIEKGKLNAKIRVLISDKKDALCLERAKRHGTLAVFLDPGEFRHVEGKELRREFYDKKMYDILKMHNVELILLIGYMRIISPFLIKKFQNKILNIHPSLLPDFAGEADLDVHSAVLKAGKKKTGCTLHFVNEQLDSGPIVMQKEISVDANDTAQSLKVKVQQAEQQVLLKALELYSLGKISVRGDKVVIER